MQSIIKNITTTVLLVAILCLISLIGAQEGKEGSEIKLVPVYEKTFAASVVDVIFDTVTVSIEEAKAMGWKEAAITEKDSANREIAISYPKVVIVSHGRRLGYYAPAVKRSSGSVTEIRFYDRKGKLLNVVEIGKLENDEWDQIHISPNCKYILISHIPSETNSGYTGGILYDFTGKKIREIKGPTPIAISDEGYMIAAYLDWQAPPEPGGSFYIYNSEGRLIQTIENPSKEKTAPLFAKYTEDGENAVLV
ncbi:MAG: hypothetical protein OEZ20_05170, partial [candidate division WOR-3 bacterium]|nr:hypothetical protein [candidate division WOR-3 bacterium]